MCSQGWIDNLNGPSGLFIAVSSLYTYVIDLTEVERDYHRRKKENKGHHEVMSTVIVLLTGKRSGGEGCQFLDVK